MRAYLISLADKGDPIFLQHFMWILGQPSTWITLFLFACLLVGIVKMTKRIWRKMSWVWGLGFLFVVGISVAYYIWLSNNAVEFYRQGRGSELVQLNIAKLIVMSLSLLSLVWIVISYFRRRKTGVS